MAGSPRHGAENKHRSSLLQPWGPDSSALGGPDPSARQEKKKYCCKTKFVGCAGESQHEVSESEPQGEQAEETSDSRPKEADDAALPQYDCSAGFPEHVKDWSSTKRDYCCKTSGRACEGDEAPDEAPDAGSGPGPPPYNCQKGLAYVDNWSHSKRKHCCESEHVGCDGDEPQTQPGPGGRSAPGAPEGDGQTQQGPEDLPTANAPEFDCDKGWPEHVGGWSEDKRAQCCERRNRGCPGGRNVPGAPEGDGQTQQGPEDLPTANAPQFDCDKGWPEDVGGWSEDKRAQCCERRNRGCPGGRSAPGAPEGDGQTQQAPEDLPTANEPQFDCDKGWPEHVGGWSEDKRAQCCERRNRGCPGGRNVPGAPEGDGQTQQRPEDLPTANEPQFDCDKGWPEDVGGWSEDKRAQCCERRNRGCPGGRSAPGAPEGDDHPTANAPQFDCDKGWPEDVRGWSEDKRAQCCERRNRGCPGGKIAPSAPARQEAAFNCDVGKPEHWSLEKRLQCCEDHSIGCDVAAPSSAPAEFNCDVGKPEHWSWEKRLQCCEDHSIGCDAPAPSSARADFNCDVGKPEHWSFEKRLQCCEDHSIGCDVAAPSSAPAEFNCDVGKPEHWSLEKRLQCCRLQCCEDHNIGCHVTPADKRFDCEAGYPTHVAGWSQEKRSYCCESDGIACGDHDDNQLTFRCEFGYDNGAWERGWSDRKKQWCCEHEGRGCAGDSEQVYFNCEVGDEKDWSARKRDWCCNNEGRGCDGATLKPETEPPLFDCTVGKFEDWSDEKANFCLGHTSSNPYNCDHGYSNWQIGWSAEKKKWCCDNEDRGCDDYDCTVGKEEDWSDMKKKSCCHRPGASCEATPPPNFDCKAGYSNWQDGWSAEKKRWCCAEEDRGCDGAASKPEVEPSLFDCSVGKAEDWSEAKRAFCADHAQGATSYDCESDGSLWDRAWSESKKEWCCANRDRGCSSGIDGASVSTATTSSPVASQLFDCDAGFSNWKDGWSDAKKIWCCDHEDRGCKPNGPTSPAFDCSAGLSNWEDGWSAAKKSWCCDHEDRGCKPTGTTSPAYDCDAGYANWQAGWSHDKKAWCCEHANHGCPVDQASGNSSDQYDCDAEYDSWEDSWGQQQQAWCCQHRQRGCRVPEVDSEAYNCSAGLGAPASSLSIATQSWSNGKKVWCCLHEHVGCTDVICRQIGGCEERPPPRFDCETEALPAGCPEAGIAPSDDQKQECDWAFKQAWCCQHENKLCTAAGPSVEASGNSDGEASGNSDQYDCDAEYDSWEDSWDQEQQVWCCQHKQRGCRVPQVDSEAYNCSVGLGNSEPAWSNGKKVWCCSHERVGCTDVICRQIGGCEERPPPRFDCETEALPAGCPEAGNGSVDWSSALAHVLDRLKKRVNESNIAPSDDQKEECDWAFKQAWCCQHENKLCTAAGPSVKANVRKFEMVARGVGEPRPPAAGKRRDGRASLS
ncbi:unnamed protein product [Prorocentrum cordatum]|uniref:Uncharacterized protein n=1 Tax=Prorocentrum cordatum TaxID=2364126 RepID=A0ABN9RTU5_9DINO|nr:unnamed protein product [Polarella glacialis]